MADCKRKTANLAPNIGWVDGYITQSGGIALNTANGEKSSDFIPIQSGISITYSYRGGFFPEGGDRPSWRAIGFYKSDKSSISRVGDYESVSLFTQVPNNTAYIRLTLRTYGQDVSNVMLNIGSIALPYEPYGWVHSIRKYSTSTDTTTTLPVVIYPTDTTATVDLKGDTIQNGTPTPSNPITPQGCGDLEKVGAKAGQYKIPISNDQQTTNIYLGSTSSTRQIQKLVVDTDASSWNMEQDHSIYRYYYVPKLNYWDYDKRALYKCTHAVYDQNWWNDGFLLMKDNSTNNILLFVSHDITSKEDWVAYLNQQKNNGTPVTIWGVLATPETGIANEPLMKIGDYADELSNVSIPVTAGGDTLSVDTTIQPSEVTVNYKGWHPAIVHEHTNGAWT